MTINDLRPDQRATQFHIEENPASFIMRDMGSGKTITTLTAYTNLLDSEEISKVLIIAPKNVVNTVWHKEARNWTHTADKRFSLIVGTPKQRVNAVKEEADFYVVSRDNIKWLVTTFRKNWKWDALIIDESSSFKNHASQRFKYLKIVLNKFKHKTLLTGTPSPNGEIDLWSQMYILDKGERLGKNITAYRNKYFDTDFFGYTYTLKENMQKVISNKIKDIAFNLDIDLKLPPIIKQVVDIPMSNKLMKQYKTLENDMLIELANVEIFGESAVAIMNKLMQFSSGFVYDVDGNHHTIHSLKIDYLKELIEDTGNFLVAYNFKVEKEQILANIAEAVLFDGTEVMLDKWNSGNIKLLLVHPASSGHGLNLQKGGNNIVWYGFTWSLENYQQLNKRLHRVGQTKHVNVFHLAVGAVEYKLMQRLKEKDVSQKALLDSVTLR